MNGLRHAVTVVLGAGLLVSGVVAGERRAFDGPDSGRTYRIVATGARLNRLVTGPVAERVQGVPARPVDSFVWDGAGSTPIDGEIVIEVDPDLDRGGIVARWTDENGEWLYTQTRFIHPHHASGVRIGSSVTDVDVLLNDPVITNVHLHGDTGAGQPVLPTVFAYLAAWGPATVSLDGRLFRNPFELPAPSWGGHLMVTHGVRGEDGAVRTRDGAVYDPSRGSEGAADPADVEVHLVFHDERFPVVAGNVPPLFSFFYHLVFEDVRIEILHGNVPEY